MLGPHAQVHHGAGVQSPLHPEREVANHPLVRINRDYQVPLIHTVLKRPAREQAQFAPIQLSDRSRLPLLSEGHFSVTGGQSIPWVRTTRR